MVARFQWRVWIAPVVLVSVSARATNLANVIEVYRQNRYALRNGAGSYENADPSDRKVIQGYYAELEAASLLAPMTESLEVTATNSQAMIGAISQAVASTGPISKKVESCLGSRDLATQQTILNQTARASRVQLESTSAGIGYRAPIELDLDSAIHAYNAVSGRDWTKDFISCCQEAASDKLNQTGRTDSRDVVNDSLRESNEAVSSKVANLLNGDGCDRAAEKIAATQTTFATQEYRAPSKVIDPLKDLKMSPVELATVLRSSGVRGGLRTIREHASNPTMAMYQELSYFEDIDSACKKAKQDQFNKQNSVLSTVAKIGLSATVCHILPLLATQKGSLGVAQMSYVLADATMALPWKQYQCDPLETQAYRMQRPMDPNAIALKWNIPQMQNLPFLNRLRGMVPLTTMPIVKSLDGSVIMPGGGVIGSPIPMMGQNFPISAPAPINVNVGPNLLAPRMLASQNSPNVSNLGFLAAPSSGGGINSYVRPVNSHALAVSGAVNGVRALAGNVDTFNSRASLSAATLKQSATQGRALASSLVTDMKGRGLAVLQPRVESASLTRGLVDRAIASKSSRVSAEWIAQALSAGRSASPAIQVGNGGQPVVPTAQAQQDKVNTELARLNEARRQALLTQANAMVNQIQNAVSRSAEIVSAIQSKIQARDVIFNQTVQSMVKKSLDAQNSMVRDLITQDGPRLQEIATLKAEYDGLAASVPMLTSSLNRLGGLNPLIQTQMTASFTNSQFNTLPTAGADGRFSGSSNTSVFAPASTVPAPTVNTSGLITKISQPMENFTLRLFMPEAFAALGTKGTASYERAWAKAYDDFAADWDQYLVKLREVEQGDRQALVGRFVELTQKPDKLKLREPDAATFSLMWNTMEAISEESKGLLMNRSTNTAGNPERYKTYQDIEVAQAQADKAIDQLAEWARGYVKTAPKSYYDDPQAWEVMLPDAILY